MTTPQTQTIGVANQIINVAGQFKELYDLIAVVQSQWTDLAVANTLNAQPTTPLDADGSLGDTPDSTPNVQHPITTTGISRSLSANEITSMKTVLDAFKSYVDGQAVPATPGVRAIISKATG